LIGLEKNTLVENYGAHFTALTVLVWKILIG